MTRNVINVVTSVWLLFGKLETRTRLELVAGIASTVQDGAFHGRQLEGALQVSGTITSISYFTARRKAKATYVSRTADD